MLSLCVFFGLLLVFFNIFCSINRFQLGINLTDFNLVFDNLTQCGYYLKSNTKRKYCFFLPLFACWKNKIDKKIITGENILNLTLENVFLKKNIQNVIVSTFGNSSIRVQGKVKKWKNDWINCFRYFFSKTLIVAFGLLLF